MSTPARSTARHNPPPTARAFTLIEMLVAIGVLALVVSLLIVGLNRATKSANDAAGRMNVASLRTSTEQFIRQFSFPPPLVKDWAETPEIYRTVVGEKRLSVYEPSMLPTENLDRKVLRRGLPTLVAPPVWSDGSSTGDVIDYYDIRYSNVSLPFYLAGACEEKGASSWQVPIDGLAGPGFLEPRQDGTFVVPDPLKAAATAKSINSTGRRFDSMVDTSKGGLKIVPSADLREFRDNKDRKYRYYLWIQGDATGKKTNTAKLNIPRIILETMSRPEDRFKALGTNKPSDRRSPLPELNTATWAILWPGPDGAFGDEPIADLRLKLGASAGEPELKVRERAISDNIAEVGQ